MAHESGLVTSLEAATHRVLDCLDHRLRDLGLSHGEINVLGQLSADEARPVAALVDATGQRPSTLTGILDRLESRGLVRREVNPGDRRSFVLRLTALGEDAAADVRREFAALECEVAALVSTRALQGFYAVCAALNEVRG